jgi:hypothetical protein
MQGLSIYWKAEVWMRYLINAKNKKTIRFCDKFKQLSKNTDFLNNILILSKSGELFGAYSFFSGGKREASILSKGFSSVFEIKKSDFLSIIHKNKADYV